MKFPTEKHLQEFESDKFGYKELSKRLLDEVLLKMELPNCFGLYGNWGSGKSTMIDFMKQHIEGDSKSYEKVIPIYFEPWKYEYSDQNNLLFALLNCIKNKLGINKALWKPLAVDVLTIGNNFLKSSKVVDVKEVAGDMKFFEGKIFEEHETWVNRVEKLRDSFQKIVRDGMKRKKVTRLIIFIDDLDRCLPENSVKLLEAMKNFLAVEGTLFVLAIDRRVISEMVEKKYGLHAGYGEEYLTKIVHYYYELNKHKQNEIVRVVLDNHEIKYEEKQLAWISSFLKEFASEPRIAKHLLHQFCMKNIISSKISDLLIKNKGDVQLQYLFMAFFLLAKFPKVFTGDVQGIMTNIRDSAYTVNTEHENAIRRYPNIDTADRKRIESVIKFLIVSKNRNNIEDLVIAMKMLKGEL